MVMQNMCFISTNTTIISIISTNNRHANKQLVNSENCSLY